MSEFTSEFELFTTVTDGVDWSSPNNVLDDSDLSKASTWFSLATMGVDQPLISVPGGIPVINAVTINDLQMQIRWQRAGDVGSNGSVRLYGFNIGAGAIAPFFSSGVEVEPLHTDQLGGDETYWGATQQEMKDFIGGVNPLTFARSNHSINGSAQVRIAWVKVQIQYTYTGAGVAFPRLF